VRVMPVKEGGRVSGCVSRLCDLTGGDAQGFFHAGAFGFVAWLGADIVVHHVEGGGAAKA